MMTASAARAGHAAVGLGTADSFAVLAGSTVTNTGPTVVNGDLGLSPGSAVVGFPPGLVNGTIHVADAVALQAQSDLTIAYDDAAGRPCAADLTDQDLGGQVLTDGTYCFSTSAQLTGTVTFDAEGDPNAVFIVQIGSTLTTASASSVNLVNGADPCNIYWQVGSSATLGTATVFQGNILALTSITLNTGATIQGRALARNGAVTLDTNVITGSVCAVGPAPTASPAPTIVPTAAPGLTPSPAPTASPAPTIVPTATPAPAAPAGPTDSATGTPETAGSRGVAPSPRAGLPDTSTTDALAAQSHVSSPWIATGVLFLLGIVLLKSVAMKRSRQHSANQ